VTYQLVLREPGEDEGKAVGENVLLANLPAEFPVYAFYYPAELPDPAFEGALRHLGERTGNNFFINMGRLDDPQLDKIVKTFGIESFPTVVVTAVADLAAPPDELLSSFVRIDGRLLATPDRAISHIEKVYLLFLRGEVAKAISGTKWSSRGELARKVGQFFTSALRGLLGYIADRDLTISVLEGRFEITKSG
jgi:hypothetical protein